MKDIEKVLSLYVLNYNIMETEILLEDMPEECEFILANSVKREKMPNSLNDQLEKAIIL